MAAIVMAMALEMTVWLENAADHMPTADGGVIVENPQERPVYILYMLFDADMGANDAITYTLPDGKTEGDLKDAEGNSWFELNSNGFVVAKTDTGDEWAKNPAARAWAEGFATQVENSIKAGEGTDVKWEGLAYGYYYVDTTSGSFIGVNSANKKAEILEKNEEPKINKEITGVNGSEDTLGNGDETTDAGSGANEKAIAQIGDQVSYKLTVQAKPGAENYVVTDTLSAGLTPPEADSVTVSSDVGTYTVEVDEQVITVTFTKEYLDSIQEAVNITIEYTATLNASAVTGEDGNDNEVKLTWGNNPEENYSEDDSKVYTAEISVVKNDGETRGLAGAEFALKNSDGEYYFLDGDSVTWVKDVADATKFTSGEDGKLDGSFVGLSNGEYTLEETVVPDGYNAIDSSDKSLKVVIDGKDYTNGNLKQEKIIVNQAGTTLPSTGGIGTTIFYVAGAILILGAGVLLITRRRMKNV